MYTDVNLDALKRLVRNNENAAGFNLRAWTAPCGTYGCYVGNDQLACGNRPSRTALFRDIAPLYGLGTLVASWLFGVREVLMTPRGIHTEDSLGQLVLADCGDDQAVIRNETDKTAGLNRINKYIAYIERKRALLHEPDGRIKESARRTEGNWMVCPQVMQSLALAS